MRRYTCHGRRSGIWNGPLPTSLTSGSTFRTSGRRAGPEVTVIPTRSRSGSLRPTATCSCRNSAGCTTSKRRDGPGACKNIPVTASYGKWSVSIQTEQKVEETIPRDTASGIEMKAARFACEVSALLILPAAGTHRTGSIPSLGHARIPGIQAGEDINA